jgi:hypothetical protein
MYKSYKASEDADSKRTAKALIAELGLLTKSDIFPQFI